MCTMLRWCFVSVLWCTCKWHIIIIVWSPWAWSFVFILVQCYVYGLLWYGAIVAMLYVWSPLVWSHCCYDMCVTSAGMEPLVLCVLWCYVNILWCICKSCISIIVWFPWVRNFVFILVLCYVFESCVLCLWCFMTVMWCTIWCKILMAENFDEWASGRFWQIPYC